MCSGIFYLIKYPIHIPTKSGNTCIYFDAQVKRKYLNDFLSCNTMVLIEVSLKKWAAVYFLAAIGTWRFGKGGGGGELGTCRRKSLSRERCKHSQDKIRPFDVTWQMWDISAIIYFLCSFFSWSHYKH